MKVGCEINEIELVGDSGLDIASVEAICSRCDHRTESFGTSESSIKRCLVLMREECPQGEENFYVED